jgi:hypothetical protein
MTGAGGKCHRTEPHVAYQRRGHLLGSRVAAVHQAGPGGAVAGLDTPNSTSLGTVPNAATTQARGTYRASLSAPAVVRLTTSSVWSSFIGSEQLTSTLTCTSPACRSTSYPGPVHGE